MSMDVNSPEAALWSENMRLKSENEHLLSALSDANAGNVELLDRVKKLNDENFALAAGACHGGYGDEFGNWRCKYQDQIVALTTGNKTDG